MTSVPARHKLGLVLTKHRYRLLVKYLKTYKNSQIFSQYLSQNETEKENIEGLKEKAENNTK